MSKFEHKKLQIRYSCKKYVLTQKDIPKRKMKKIRATRIVERKIKNEKILENKIQDETTMPMQTKFPSTTHKTPTWTCLISKLLHKKIIKSLYTWCTFFVDNNYFSQICENVIYFI